MNLCSRCTWPFCLNSNFHQCTCLPVCDWYMTATDEYGLVFLGCRPHYCPCHLTNLYQISTTRSYSLWKGVPSQLSPCHWSEPHFIISIHKLLKLFHRSIMFFSSLWICCKPDALGCTFRFLKDNWFPGLNTPQEKKVCIKNVCHPGSPPEARIYSEGITNIRSSVIRSAVPTAPLKF